MYGAVNGEGAGDEMGTLKNPNPPFPPAPICCPGEFVDAPPPPPPVM